MNKVKLSLLSLIFIFVAGCAMESRVGFQDDFLGAVQSYVSNVEDRDICSNLDDIAKLNELAVQEDKTDILRVINVEGLFFKALAKNFDVVAAMENIEALEKTTVEKECIYDASKILVCKEVGVIDNSQIVVADYLKAIFGDCMADQARFATFIDVFTNLYIKHADVMHGLFENQSFSTAYEKFDSYALCFEEADQYVINTVAPFLKSLDLGLTIEAAGTLYEKVLGNAPDCLTTMLNKETATKDAPVEAKQKVIAEPVILP